MKKKFSVFVFAMIFLSGFVLAKDKSAEELFNKFISRKTDEKYILMQTLNIAPLESLDKNYQKIIKNHANTAFLLEKAESVKKTKYYIPNLVCPMTEGDIAICMLIDMYGMSDDYFETVMYENILRKANNARDYWDYIHSSKENRTEIIQKIREWIMIVCGSDLYITSSWTEDEIINHRFELVSDDYVESFFIKKEGKVFVTSLTYGKKGKTVTVPIKSWTLKDDSLYIYPYSDTASYRKIKISRREIDKEKEIAHTYRNFKKAEYRYAEIE